MGFRGISGNIIGFIKEDTRCLGCSSHQVQIELLTASSNWTGSSLSWTQTMAVIICMEAPVVPSAVFDVCCACLAGTKGFYSQVFDVASASDEQVQTNQF